MGDAPKPKPELVRSRHAAAIIFATVAVAVAVGMGCTLLLPLDEFNAGSDAGDASDAAGDGGDGGCGTGLSLCGDACVDLKNDDMHCGACDIACKATACKSAICQPFVATTNGVLPAGIVFDGTWVTWAVTTAAPGETSYIYRLKPADFAAGLDGSAPASRTLGNVTTTHLEQGGAGDLVYSVEDRISEAGAPSQVRFLRFEVGGSKVLGQLGPGELVAGLAVRDTDAGTNVSWIAQKDAGADLGMHFGVLANGSGAEVDAAAANVSFTYNGSSGVVTLGHADAVAAGANSQLYFVANDDTSTWVVERLGSGLDGQWTPSSTKVSSTRRIRALTYDGQQQLFFAVANEIWQTTGPLNSASKIASVGASNDVISAIAADADDIYVLSAPSIDPAKGRLIRHRRAGGADTTVGTAGLAGDGALLLTKDWIFWVSDGALRFLARP